MKSYFKYLFTHLFAILTILVVSFLAPLVTIDIINNQTAYYQASFTVSDIRLFEEELLTDANFLNSIKSKATKYENIDVEKMLKKEHFQYVVEGNKITITTKVKYYDNFFNSSSLSVGTRAKTFIKDSVLDLAQEYCKVTFDNPKDIVSKENFIDNSIQISLITLGSTSLLLMILSIILYKKNITFNKEKYAYDNETLFNNCFHKKYWKLSIKPLIKVKDITLLAMLFALMLVCKLIPIPSGFGNLGIGFTYLFFAITCMIYGPVYGFVVGIFSDVLGFFFFPSTGFFHLGYTLQAALTGFIYGICFYKTKITFSKVFICRLLVNMIINVLYGSFLYILVFYPEQTDKYKELYSSYVLLMTLPKNLVYLLPQSLLLYYVIRVTLPILHRFKFVEKDMLIKKTKIDN